MARIDVMSLFSHAPRRIRLAHSIGAAKPRSIMSSWAFSPHAGSGPSPLTRGSALRYAVSKHSMHSAMSELWDYVDSTDQTSPQGRAQAAREDGAALERASSALAL